MCGVCVCVCVRVRAVPILALLLLRTPFQPVTKSADIDVVTKPGESTVELKRALRQQSGLWKLKVTNEVGSDEAEVEVVVLGKPGQPEGPLEVSDVNQDSVKLKWKPPLDNGGFDIRYACEPN